MVDNSLTSFWELLNLNTEEALICQTLSLQGEMTILALSRLIGFPRTSVYRKLEILESQGLINILIDAYTTKVKLASPEKIEQIINQKINQSQQLEKLLPQIKNQLYELDHKTHGQTQVHYFRGHEAVTRMTWGILQAQDSIRSYSSRQFAELTGLKEAKNFKLAWEKSGLKALDIVSNEYLQSQKDHPELNTGKWKNWETHFIPTSVLNIEQSMDIYDNTINIFNWSEGEVFGLQIINPKLANFHKQLFDLSWQLAKPIKS